MKISELIKSTGVSRETIHYYVREGLLKKPRKTGKNSAQYNNDHVEQLRTIKDLQGNQHLPLAAIKKILKQNRKESSEKQTTLRLISEHFKPMDRLLRENKRFSKESFLESTKIGKKWLETMIEGDIIQPLEENGELTYSSLDVSIAKLFVTMDELGFGPKDGFSPEILKEMHDYLETMMAKDAGKWIATKMEESSLEDVMEKGVQWVEAMGMYMYYIYSKIALNQLNEYLEKVKPKT